MINVASPETTKDSLRLFGLAQNSAKLAYSFALRGNEDGEDNDSQEEPREGVLLQKES